MDSGTELVQALLFGRLEGLAPETVALYARTGLIHLFSASGFHVGVAVFLARLCTRFPERWLGHRRPTKAAALLLQLAFMLFFGQATGWSSPMVRSLCFTALLTAARFFEIRPSPPWVFALSLAVSALLGRSSWLSFLLSAAGMAGVLFVRPRSFWAIALGPWLFTLPIVIWVFGLFSALAPLWNLTIGFLIAWIVMPPAVLHLLCTQFTSHDPFLGLAARAMQLLTNLLALGDSWLGGAYWVPRWPWLILLVIFAGAASLPPRWRKFTWAGIAAAAIVLRPVPRLALLDIGQGDAIFLRSESGKRILVDVGPPGRHGREAAVGQALGRVGIGHIDDILLTHPDSDHRGGLDTLLRSHQVKGALWLREEFLLGPKGGEVLGSAERAALPVEILTEAHALSGFRCRLLPAPRTTNEQSPLCRAELARSGSIWLTGDLDVKTEAALLARAHPFPPADFLKVAHHGSRFSSSAEFLRASGARQALISVGRKNRYGHPTAETLERLREAGIPVRRTDRDGSIVYF